VIVFFTDGVSGGVNLRESLKKIKEIREYSRNCGFLCLGFGKDFARNSDGWNVLKKISFEGN
jgi:hypothetical protein